jgi:pyruvate,water dikinase
LGLAIGITALLRQVFSELGRCLSEAGAIEKPEDIYWLKREEIEDTLNNMDRGTGLDPLIIRVEERKAFWRAVKDVTPPPMLPMKKKFLGFNTDIWVPVSDSEQATDTLKGVGASAGKVTAPARVLHGPEDFDQMQPGDVLVAQITTPAWTPLFAMASAVVTDVGGPLSHGSIVAREYGIPAVMGTGVATRRIQTGRIITVDGTSGMLRSTVEINDSKPAPLP